MKNVGCVTAQMPEKGIVNCIFFDGELLNFPVQMMELIGYDLLVSIAKKSLLNIWSE
jgi:hypothetical protein